MSDVLHRPVTEATSGQRILSYLGERDEITFGSLSLGDLLFDRISIDHSALVAFDFVKPSVESIYRLASGSHGIIDSATATQAGQISWLQGYVFERMAALSLQHTGAFVQWPRSPSNPGWDFLVNGAPVQAKCGVSPDLVNEHLERYPNIPRVVVNEDLAGHFTGNPYVIPIHGVTRDFVRSTTEHSLGAAADMLDWHLGLVIFTTAARNAVAVWRGASDWRAADTNFPGDLGGRVAASAAGHAVGAATAAVAVTMLGGWPAVLLPVFAEIGAYRIGRHAADAVKRRVLLRTEAEALSTALRQWCARSAAVLETMIAGTDGLVPVIAAARERSDPWYQEMFDDWRRRHSQTQQFRRRYQDLFLRGAHNPEIFGDGSGLISACANAMFAASCSGILPADLVAERQNLTDSVRRYASGLRRRLLSR